jgi:hypothetical protein
VLGPVRSSRNLTPLFHQGSAFPGAWVLNFENLVFPPEVEMGDVLNEAYRIMQCKDCQWYKSCVTPMRFSAEDLRRQMEASGQTGLPVGDNNIQSLLSGMATAAQNSLLEGCPVFIERLRGSPELAQKIKELMRNWVREG